MIPDLIFWAVVLLIGLAVMDLIVGVSNDAVNFLNSAVGSRVAPRHIILLIASLGVIAGAVFSSGMMEIARKGIFNPQFFTFSEVLIIFLAVMITDVILLDLFNTFGLPTSTTVSIVFELLGGAVAVALLKIHSQNLPLEQLASFINTEQATIIILGIFLSVIIAFFFGMLIQYVTRLVFSFEYQKRMRYAGGIWTGLSLTAIAYFLLIKGVKGASFVSSEHIFWVQQHAPLLLTGMFVAATLIAHFLIVRYRLNLLRFVVLFGTFALAMAFAGNDLVNFIGAPLAGLEAFHIWSASGAAPDLLQMNALANPVQSSTLYLALAGLIMVLTLWYSRRARTVTDTEVNLGRQDVGLERFTPNWLSRTVVGTGRSVGEIISGLIPEAVIRRIGRNFEPARRANNGSSLPAAPAFDLVRASVNLTMASIVIAAGTALKLPLSTTYVTFMVAMGTSLADRAWGRESAVYRVAGVLNVIGGWFLTAFAAFFLCMLFAGMMMLTDGYGLILAMLVTVAALVHSFRHHRRRDQARVIQQQLGGGGRMDRENILKRTIDMVEQALDRIETAYPQLVDALLSENRPLIARTRRDLLHLKSDTEARRKRLISFVRQSVDEHGEATKFYILTFDLVEELVHSSLVMADSVYQHILNHHAPLDPEQQDPLMELENQLLKLLNLTRRQYSNIDSDILEEITEQRRELQQMVEELIEQQIYLNRGGSAPARASLVVMAILLETKELAAILGRLYKKHYRFHTAMSLLEE